MAHSQRIAAEGEFHIDFHPVNKGAHKSGNEKLKPLTKMRKLGWIAVISEQNQKCNTTTLSERDR